METTMVYWGYIGTMEKKMEALIASYLILIYMSMSYNSQDRRYLGLCRTLSINRAMGT